MDNQGMILLWDIGIIILAATVMGSLARLFKQPLLLGYILAGIIIGPSIIGLITNKGIIETLAELGIAFLLFIVGLELDIGRLKNVGKVSVGCGLGQVILTLIFGYFLASALGFSGSEAFYISFALTISSTMVVIKLLSDKNELETLHGRIIIGILLVQDFATIIILGALTSHSSPSSMIFIKSMVGGMGMVILAVLSGKYIVYPLLGFITKSVELLFLFALSWCFLFSGVTHYLGFSIAIGSFLAGVSLASFPYNLEIIGRVKSLRDFFATIFFVSLGMQIPLIVPRIEITGISSIVTIVTQSIMSVPLIKEAIIFSLFVLIGNAVIMMVIATLFGYEKRTSFLIALSVAQISEFSLIIANLGMSMGQISEEISFLITFIAILTITISSYFIIHGSRIYEWLLPILKIFDRISRPNGVEDVAIKSDKHIIVFGSHRMGHNIVKILQKFKMDFLIVDYNPEVVRSMREHGISCIYGDFGDIEILERINLKDAKMVISTIPDINDNLLLIKKAKELNPTALIFVTANYANTSIRLYDAGADYVIFPQMLSGKKVSEFLEEFIRGGEKMNRINDIKRTHISQLERIENEEIIMGYNSSILNALKKRITMRNSKT